MLILFIMPPTIWGALSDTMIRLSVCLPQPGLWAHWLPTAGWPLRMCAVGLSMGRCGSTASQAAIGGGISSCLVFLQRKFAVISILENLSRTGIECFVTT